MRTKRRAAFVLVTAAALAVGLIAFAASAAADPTPCNPGTSTTDNKSCVNFQVLPSNPHATLTNASLFVHTHTNYAHPGDKANGTYTLDGDANLTVDGNANLGGQKGSQGTFNFNSVNDGTAEGCKEGTIILYTPPPPTSLSHADPRPPGRSAQRISKEPCAFPSVYEFLHYCCRRAAGFSHSQVEPKLRLPAATSRTKGNK